MKKIEFDLNNDNKLYFLPEYNRFALNDLDFNLSPDYADTSSVKLRLEITYICNGRCKYCLVYGNNVDSPEITDIEEFWKYLTSQEWFKNIKTIFIIGGEPLCCFKEISYIIDHFDGRISFSTNGTLLTKEMVEKFSKANVHVYISLDGPTFEDNKNRVYVNGDYMYPDIIKGIDLLNEYHIPFGIFMVANTNTVYKAKDMIMELDKKYSPTRIGYSLPHWTEDYTVSLAEEFRDVLIELYKNRKKINAEIPQVNWRLSPLLDGKVKKFSCGLHTTQITVLPDKSIIRCSKIDNGSKDDLGLRITNELLDKNSPIELAKDEKSDCSKCIALACCGGGCPFDGMKRFNCLTDKRECVITPPLIKMAINDVVTAFKEQNIDVPNGLVDPKIIRKILWSK